MLHESNPKHFPSHLHRMLTYTTTSPTSSISWRPHGRAFSIHDEDDFSRAVLPRWFPRLKFESFQRQLHKHGFRRLHRKGPDKGAYYHDNFQRGLPDLANTIQPVKGEGKRGRKPQGTEPDFCNMQNLEHSSADATQAAASHSTSRANPSQEGTMYASAVAPTVSGAAAGVLGNPELSVFADPSRSSGGIRGMQQGIQPREGVNEPLPAAASLPPAAQPPTNANPDSPQALIAAYTQQLQQQPPPLPSTLSASTNVTNVGSLVRQLAHPTTEAIASGNFIDNNEGLLGLTTSTSSSHAHRHLCLQASEAAGLTQQQQQQQQPTPSTSATGPGSGTTSSSLPGTATQQHMLDQQIRQHSLLLLHQVQVQQQLEDQIRQSIVERRNSRRDQQEEEGPEQKREEDPEQGEDEWSLHSLDS